MAPGNADIVRPVYEHWGRGDWRPTFEIYDPEMEWGWSDEFPDLGGVVRDPMNPNPRLRRWLSGWEEWRAEPDDFVEIGDHVIVLTRYLGRGKGSGVEIEQDGAHVFELRAGRVIRLEIFASRERALEYVEAAERDRKA